MAQEKGPEFNPSTAKKKKAKLKQRIEGGCQVGKLFNSCSFSYERRNSAGQHDVCS
jgi:hypothetical protein